MKAVVLAKHYPVCSGRYICNAIEQSGGEVRHYGPAMGRSVWGLDLPGELAWQPQSLDPTFMPDVVIVADSDAAVLDHSIMWRHIAPVVVWGVDNHVADYRREWITHYFLAHHGVSKHLLGDNVTWLPCGYDAEQHARSEIAWRDRKYDVTMLGVMYPERWEIVEALRDAGLNVVAGSGLIGKDYADIYRNSRVSLVASFNGDVPQRTFETAAMGCAVVSDTSSDLDTLNFPGGDKWTYSKDAAVEDIVKLVMSANHQPAHGAACATWAVGQSWKDRLRVVTQWVNRKRGEHAEAIP